MRELLSLVIVCGLMGATLGAQERPAPAATSPADTAGKTNPAADACAEGLVIGAAAAIVGAFALDLLGGGGVATAFTAKIVVPAIVGGCVTGMMHSALNEAKQAQPAPAASARTSAPNRRVGTPVKIADRRR